jgi:hypothetical protein
MYTLHIPQLLSYILHVLVFDFHVWCLEFNLDMIFHNLFWVLCALKIIFVFIIFVPMLI